MEYKNLNELTDHELLKEAKKHKSIAITNALLIGFLLGVIIYSTIINGFGFLTIILLFLIYKMVNKTKYKKADIDRLLKERNLYTTRL